MWVTSKLRAGIVLLAPLCCEPSQIDLMPMRDGASDCTDSGTGGACGQVPECEGYRAHYDPVSERCVQCLADDHCDSGKLCLGETKRCAQRCDGNADCTGSDEASCDLARGACVECLQDADCEHGRCEPRSGECVECLTDNDCTAPEPHCEPGRFHCEECLRDEHCDPDQVCDAEREQCVSR